MNTAAAVFGLIGSLLLMIQPALALWLRRDTEITGEEIARGQTAETAASGPHLSAVPDRTGATKEAAGEATAVSPSKGFEDVARELDSRIDTYRPWQWWSMIAGAACLAMSSLLAGLAANLG